MKNITKNAIEKKIYMI